MRTLATVYRNASLQVAEKIKQATLSGKSALTTGSMTQIQAALDISAQKIRDALQEGIERTVLKASQGTSKITASYLADLPSYADKITIAGIRNMTVAVDNAVVSSLVSRIYRDGYSYSQRIWKVGESYQNTVKKIMAEGLAQGRPLEKIAGDLTAYVKEGRQGIARRWGEFKEGVAGFRSRIPMRIDYNALRLVRSELYSSMQVAARWQGIINPGTTGEYNWKRTNADNWDCDCQELSDGSPYTADNLPDYPHPHCACMVIPILMPRSEFINDMKDWGNGGDVPYIQQWFDAYYKPGA
jgi:hypothetical protein